MKTILEHFKGIENIAIRNATLRNLDAQLTDVKATSLGAAILRGFDWIESPEGVDFWSGIVLQDEGFKKEGSITW